MEGAGKGTEEHIQISLCLPEVVKIKGMHRTPDQTAWTSPPHGEKKRKVLLPEQA